MARIRTIKPEFFTSEDIVGMSPLARLFYVSLWCESDREGRLEWKPGTFKMRYLPGDNCSVDERAQELINNGLIILYATDGKKYCEIPTFTEHQVINNREHASTIPPRVSTPLSRVEAEGREGKERKEGKGKEGTCPAQEPDAPSDEFLEESAEKRKRRRSTPEDEKAARWMYGLVLTVNAAARPPNFDIWGDEVRLMREIDGRTHKDICELFAWAKKDAFWCANIQSPSKLREKWDQLTEQRQRPGRAGSTQSGKFQVAGVDHSSSVAAMAASMQRHGTIVPDDGEISFDD